MTAIIDAHHHVWRRCDPPWLAGPMRPRIFGPYEPIRRDYLMEEYLADIAGCGVAGSVYVQANWAAERSGDEAAWVQAVAEETGWPQAMVGHADFTVEDVGPQLERLARHGLVRGVRQQLHWHENESYRFAARPDLAADPALRRNVARLADYGWAFDLQVFAPQMEDAAGLADACSDVRFVLQHAGMLEDRSAEGRARWRSGMRALAERPNVFAKLSGLGTFLHRNDAAHVAEVVDETLAMFGPGRCMFGSNFPIEKLWTGYGELVDAYRAATAGLDEAEREAVFRGTAAEVYRLA